MDRDRPDAHPNSRVVDAETAEARERIRRIVEKTDRATPAETDERSLMESIEQAEDPERLRESDLVDEADQAALRRRGE